MTGPPVFDRRTAWALYLDVDGTLLEIADTPDSVRVSPSVLELLAALRDAARNAVALVSGRPIVQLDALFHPLRLPCAGLHGLERRDAEGVIHRPPLDPRGLRPARKLLKGFVSTHSGVLLEDKNGSLALHYRLGPQHEAATRRVARQALQRLGSDYCLLEGKMVLELKPDGFSKSTAIAAFERELPFSGRMPIFLGDDRTDEAGFRYIEGIGGCAIHVGAHESTHARWRLPDVAAVHHWLEALLDARRDQRSAS